MNHAAQVFDVEYDWLEEELKSVEQEYKWACKDVIDQRSGGKERDRGGGSGDGFSDKIIAGVWADSKGRVC